MDSGTRGAYHFDAFASDRAIYLGPDPNAVIQPPPPPTDALFADEFESGGLSAWSASSFTDDGDLSVTGSAALINSLGLQAVLDDNAGIYVQDDSPNAEARYRARFYPSASLRTGFDPNSAAMANNAAHYIFYGYTGTTAVLRIKFGYTTANGYRLRLSARDNANAWTTGAWVNLTDAPHVIELDWQSSTTGSVNWWIDETQQTALTNVDNSNRRIDRIHLGAMAGVDSTTSGTLYFDAFESRRASYIGPMVGPLVNRTVTFTYDSLYRVTDVAYSSGEAFHYRYDPVGNVTEYTRAVAGQTIVTTYTYNEGNQLVTAQADNDPTVWHYLYDNNGSLTDVIPNGTTPVNGARRYAYDAAGRLVKAELHNGADYQPQAEMLYDGLGNRVSMTGWQDGLSATTTYALDLAAREANPLAATSEGNTTFYLYAGSWPVGELTTAWAYYLNDGTNTPRQMTDATGEVTLARSYTPWGEVLEQNGAGNFTWGYFGGLMDAATGLIYVGGGQYYDPATGRFLTRLADPNATNPYVPVTDPLGAAMAPFGLLAVLAGRKKRSKADRLLLMLVILAGASLALAACSGKGVIDDTDPRDPTAPNTPPASGSSSAPTATATAQSTQTQAPSATASATQTATPTKTPCPTLTATVLPDFDPNTGPVLPRTDWIYYDAVAKQHLNDKRVEFSSTVLYWLRYYEGEDYDASHPGPWWKKSPGTELSNLDFEKIKAFVVIEGNVFANSSFQLGSQGGEPDDVGWNYETQVHPLFVIGGSINERLDPLIRSQDHDAIAAGFSYYTAFFDPVDSPTFTFDRNDWDRWVRGPQSWQINVINAYPQAPQNSQGESVDRWWQEWEIQCRKTPYTDYTFVWRRPPNLRGAGDTGRFFAGTAQQFQNSCIGPG